MRPKRGNVSEFLYTTMSAFTFLTLMVMPGGLLMWALPWWLGVPLAVAIASLGPWMIHRLDEDLYGPRE